jgi:hypothetical protein
LVKQLREVREVSWVVLRRLGSADGKKEVEEIGAQSGKTKVRIGTHVLNVVRWAGWSSTPARRSLLG